MLQREILPASAAVREVFPRTRVEEAVVLFDRSYKRLLRGMARQAWTSRQRASTTSQRQPKPARSRNRTKARRRKYASCVIALWAQIVRMQLNAHLGNVQKRNWSHFVFYKVGPVRNP